MVLSDCSWRGTDNFYNACRTANKNTFKVGEAVMCKVSIKLGGKIFELRCHRRSQNTLNRDHKPS